MYYEEKWIDGQLYWRGTPDGEFKPASLQKTNWRLYEEIQRNKALVKVLREVYEEQGPGSRGGGMGREPAESYAAMAISTVDEIWDHGSRHLMHRVAKAIVGEEL